MNPQELIEHLQKENGTLREENGQLRAENQQLWEQVEQLGRRLHELEGRVAKDSHNSSKPPSTDGYAKKTRSLRKASGKKPGGQEGHAGSTRHFVEMPDEIIIVRPQKCARCQASLQELPAEGYERRQRVDLPEIKAQVTEYQALEVRCPGCQLSPGTLLAFVAEGADRLVETEELIKQALRAAEVLGTDETGIRVQGVLHWLHVARTDTLTHYAVHRKRGKAATDAIGILPQFHGIMEHDGYSSYPQYTHCEHAQCNAHPLRELCFLEEHEKQAWAGQLKAHLLACHLAVEEARARGETSLPTWLIEQLTTTYHQLVEAGLAGQPPPLRMPHQRGRVKQTKAKNLLDRLERDAQSILLFLSDFRVPFTNNGSEQDLRMVKVQQKISGTFRSETGPVAFCRIRGYLSTMAKQGHRLCLVARQLFAGLPLSPLGAV